MRQRGDEPKRPMPDHEFGPLCRSGTVRLLGPDYDPALCRLIAAALAPQRFPVDTVSEPAQIEHHLKQEPYALIILDYVIPGVATEQILNWVRDYQAAASITVVTAFPSIDS